VGSGFLDTIFGDGSLILAELLLGAPAEQLVGTKRFASSRTPEIN